MENRPALFKAFGIYCWHAYNTNPKLIEIYFSKDNVTYALTGKFGVALVKINDYFLENWTPIFQL